ncbi:MAG: TonB-dependent receptor [Acidobacteriota bacterium]|nr:TonB-dependent receptor [Acidobacteriota bacterium]
MVVDENDAAIRGAVVTLLNRDKTMERRVATDDNGGFVFLLLPADGYILRAQSEGFAPVEIQALTLSTGDLRSIRIRMNVASVGATVTIIAQPDAPTTKPELSIIGASNTMGTAIGRGLIETLPLNGRSFLGLLTLSPGVVLTRATVDEQGQFSASGQRANANYFTVDGVGANSGITAAASLGQAGAGALPALSATGGTNSLVSIEALQEVKIQTSSYAAEFGRVPGAQVSLTTRSGANGFSGALFNYFRNDAMDANDWFANRAGLPKAALRQNDFGGSFSGPVVLPGLGAGAKPLFDGRDRTFFFFSYEGLRLRQPLFGSQLVPSLGALQKTSAAIKAILNAYPLPNGEEVGNGLAKFSASYSDPTRLDAVGIRFDHAINAKQSLFVRLNNSPSQTSQRTGSLSRSLVTEFDHRSLTVGAAQSFSPRFSNDLRFGFTASRGTNANRSDDFGGAIPPDEKLLFPNFTSSQDSSISIFTLGLEPLAIGRSVDNRQRQINLVDGLSLSTGRHHLKFGVDLRLLSPASNPSRYEQAINFLGVAGADGFPSLAGTLLSERASSVQITSREAVRLAFINFSAYAQDGWRIASRLSLTYGLRWEFNPPPSAGDGKEIYTLTDFNNLSATAIAPRVGALWQTGYGNFAPRIGLAYQINSTRQWQTVLRGGAGLFYDLGAGNIAATASSFPYVRSRSLFELSGIPYPLAPSRVEPLPFDGGPPYESLEAFDPQLKLPRTIQWSLSAEQSLGAQQTLMVSYVGAAGRGLLRREALRSFNPNFGAPLFITHNAATSDYHALHVQFQRRLARRLQMLAAYAWSHSIDLASNDSAPLTPADRLDPQLDRGASDFDVRHQLSGTMSFALPKLNDGRIGERLLGGWAVDSIFRARTATPVNVAYARDIGFGFFNGRPDLLSDVPVFIDDPNAPGGRQLNLGAFLKPKELRQGSLGRNTLRGFPFWQVDLALRRQFDLAHRIKLQLRAEVFNLFNHPNFGDPRSTLTDPLFGASGSLLNHGLGGGGASGGLNPVYQIGGARSVQLVLRFAF